MDIAFYARRKVDELDLFVELMNLFATDVKVKIEFECRMESEYFDTQWMRDEYSASMSEELQLFAVFRNRMVHLY